MVEVRKCLGSVYPSCEHSALDLSFFVDHFCSGIKDSCNIASTVFSLDSLTVGGIFRRHMSLSVFFGVVQSLFSVSCLALCQSVDAGKLRMGSIEGDKEMSRLR